MHIEDLIELCEEFNAMGDVVQSQLHDVLDDTDSIPEQNSNAVKRIQHFLKMCQRRGVDGVGAPLEAIKEYQDAERSEIPE